MKNCQKIDALGVDSVLDYFWNKRVRTVVSPVTKEPSPS